jgi:hypothetical protein
MSESFYQFRIAEPEIQIKVIGHVDNWVRAVV